MHITNNDPSKNYLQLTFVSYPLVCKALIFLPSDLESTSRQIHTTVKICHKGPPQANKGRLSGTKVWVTVCTASLSESAVFQISNIQILSTDTHICALFFFPFSVNVFFAIKPVHSMQFNLYVITK